MGRSPRAGLTDGLPQLDVVGDRCPASSGHADQALSLEEGHGPVGADHKGVLGGDLDDDGELLDVATLVAATAAAGRHEHTVETAAPRLAPRSTPRSDELWQMPSSGWVRPTCQDANPNVLVTGATMHLSAVHAKIRRAGYHR